MPIRVEIEGLIPLEFPDGTDDAVIERAKKAAIANPSEFKAPTQPEETTTPDIQEPIGQAPSIPAPEDPLARLKEFESSRLGRALDLPGKLLGQKPISKQIERAREIKGLPLGAATKEFGRDLLSETARAAPLLIPVGKAAKAGKVASLFIESAKNAAITGSAAGVEALAEGETPIEAAKTAAGTGAAAGTLTLAIPGAIGVAKFSSKRLLRLFSDVNSFALDAAIKNPKIIKGNLPKLVDAGEATKAFLDDHANNVKKAFETGLDQLTPPSGKVIPLNKVGKNIKKLGIDKELLKSKLQASARREAIPISDDLINRVVEGKKVGFNEARKVNSLLFDITSGSETEVIGKGLIGKLERVKKSLLDSLDDSVEGIRAVNRNFATEAKKLKDLNKVFGDPGKKEATIRQLAKQAGGQQKNKTALLRQLEEIPGSESIVTDLLESAAAEEFDKLGAPNLFKIFGAGSAGGFAAGIPGAVAGAGAQVALSSRPGLEAAATLGKAFGRAAPLKGLINPVSREAGFQTRSLIRRKKE